MSTTHDILKESIEKILNLMDFDTEYSIKEQLDPKTNNSVFICAITAQKDSKFLIGQRGSNLYALEHILRSILHKNNCTEKLNIDINGYKADKDRVIKNIALDAANQAAQEKKPIILRPMNGYERRIVHMAIDNDNRVETESVGEGAERKVIIKPQSIMESL